LCVGFAVGGSPTPVLLLVSWRHPYRHLCTRKCVSTKMPKKATKTAKKNWQWARPREATQDSGWRSDCGLQWIWMIVVDCCLHAWKGLMKNGRSEGDEKIVWAGGWRSMCHCDERVAGVIFTSRCACIFLLVDAREYGFDDPGIGVSTGFMCKWPGHWCQNRIYVVMTQSSMSVPELIVVLANQLSRNKAP
jgi:hypothetical protein